jgi:hypothetical protein
MILLHEDCEPELASHKELPRDSYLISYMNSENKLTYDIVRGKSMVEIFDYYWDIYRSVVQIKWTSGTIKPKAS